jgi:predicted nuclease of predicted toxin-antitoxin system
MDKDFGRLVFAEGSNHCGLVRLPDVPVASRLLLMDEILERYGGELAQKAVVTVRGNRIRVSRTEGA